MPVRVREGIDLALFTDLQVAKVMKDGATLRAAFQRGSCKAKGKCVQGAHRCCEGLLKQP